MHVETELLLRLHQREALGVGLHEAVLDAVVHHFHEVTGAARAHAVPALIRGGGERLEGGAQALHYVLLAAHHHRVTLVESPNATARTDVHIVDALLGDLFTAAHALAVVGVAALDEGVARVSVRQERFDRGVDGGAARHHDPERARGTQLRREVLERGRGSGAFFAEFGDGVLVEVEDGDVMSAAHEPARDVGAHLS